MAKYFRRKKYCRFSAEGLVVDLHHRNRQDRAEPYYGHQRQVSASARNGR